MKSLLNRHSDIKRHDLVEYVMNDLQISLRIGLLTKGLVEMTSSMTMFQDEVSNIFGNIQEVFTDALEELVNWQNEFDYPDKYIIPTSKSKPQLAIITKRSIVLNERLKPP